MSEAEAPVAGPLTVDQAVASLLTPEPTEEQAPEAPEAAAEEPQTEGDDQSPEDTPDEAAEPSEGEETEAEDEPVVAAEPPKYWSKDAKEAFGKLPPDLQAVVLAQEGPREEAAAKAKAEAAERIKAADAEMSKVSQLAEQLGEFLPRAVQKFASQWGADPDWVAYAQEHGAEAMTIAKAQYDADAADLLKLQRATEQAQAEAQTAYVKAEFAKLAEIAPELADPTEGLTRRQEITKYLVAQGVDPEGVRNISATEMLLAQKAMKWDAAQAAARAAPKPKPAPPPKAAVRPSPAQGQSSAQRTAQQIQNRFSQTRSVDDAVALLLAKKA